MTKPITVVQYWAGCPRSANSKWRRFLAIVQRCQEQGWRNYLIWSTLPENPALVEPFREVGCEIILQSRSRGNFDLTGIWRTYTMLRRLKCDVFHCYNDHTSPLIGAVMARVPVRVWSKLAMSSYYERGVEAKGLHRLALSSKISCALSTRVLARSEAVKQELIAEGAMPDKISVSPVDVDVSLYADVSALDLKEELGYAESCLIVTSVGHAVPVKGWDILISSFSNIVRRYPDARLLLVGDIPSGNETAFAESLRARVRQNGLDDKVRFLGHRDDIPRILAMSDVFVLPSRSEGQPGALLEAMATGLPCVGTRVGGIPELIENDYDGLLVGRDNADDLTFAITKLLADRALRETLGRRARSLQNALTSGNLQRACFPSMQVY